MATIGRYITDSDVDNWSDAGITTDAEKKPVIDRVEQTIEKQCKRIFWEKRFDIKVDGNGRDRIMITKFPEIQYVSDIRLYNVSLSSDVWTWNTRSVYRELDSGSGAADVELRYVLNESGMGKLFPKGNQNIRIVGTYGMPRRLDIESASGLFTIGESVTGTTSGEVAYVKEDVDDDDYLLIYGMGTTNFTDDETITGGTSEVTATVNNAAGAEYYPPSAIKKACIILATWDNDPTTYIRYREGEENLGGHQYQTAKASKERFTGIDEVDMLITDWVWRGPIMSA